MDMRGTKEAEPIDIWIDCPSALIDNQEVSVPRYA
jgi:hypothetical protein